MFSLVYLLGLLVIGAPAPAFALAAAWGLHPLLTESVTNIVGRADLLAAFGVLAGFCVTCADSRGRRKGFRGERENDSGVKTNGIPG